MPLKWNKNDMTLFHRQKMHVIQRTVAVDANVNHFLGQRNMHVIAT